EEFTLTMLERAGQERLAPMLMTALCAGIALIPLTLAAGQPGKEILYPVATVIVGGLISSTLLDFFVHPALFWLFGRKSAEQQIKERKTQTDLNYVPDPESTRESVLSTVTPHVSSNDSLKGGS
ncbi:MAG: efflux RND transporter permease subunit, partial [Thermoguttaceae bacterium]